MGVYQEYSSLTQQNRPRDNLTPISDGLDTFSDGWHTIRDRWDAWADHIGNVPVVGDLFHLLMDNPAVAAFKYVLDFATMLTDGLQKVFEPLENNPVTQFVYHGQLGAMGLDHTFQNDELFNYVANGEWRTHRGDLGFYAGVVGGGDGDPFASAAPTFNSSSVTAFVPQAPGSHPNIAYG
jgi:hypothetical protein